MGSTTPQCSTCGDLGNPHRLRALFRTRFGPSGLALAAQRGPDLSDANPLWCSDPVDRPELHRNLSCADKPGLRRRLCLRKSRRQITLDATGRRKRQTRKLPRSEWSVLIPEHHPGFIDWPTYEANRSRIAANTHPQPHHSGGAVREGSALLQGLASCGACGRRLRTHYTGRTASPGYHCAGKNIVDGRGIYCLSVGAVQIDGAVARALLAALAPAGLEAALAAAERLEADRDDALAQCRLAAERARYEAQRAERRYRAVDAENRLVARGLESEWEQRLRELEQAKAELARRERERPRALSAEDRRRLLALGADLQSVWEASTTTAKHRLVPQ